MGKTKKLDSKSKKKHKHKERKEKRKKPKKHSKEKKKDDEVKEHKPRAGRISDEKLNDDFSIPVRLMSNKSHAPETPEEYRQRQNRIRREVDPVTGRSRLIKGDGEVLEEIVSKERHKVINKEATKGDGDFFQDKTVNKQL